MKSSVLPVSSSLPRMTFCAGFSVLWGGSVIPMLMEGDHGILAVLLIKAVQIQRQLLLDEDHREQIVLIRRIVLQHLDSIAVIGRLQRRRQRRVVRIADLRHSIFLRYGTNYFVALAVLAALGRHRGSVLPNRGVGISVVAAVLAVLAVLGLSGVIPPFSGHKKRPRLRSLFVHFPILRLAMRNTVDTSSMPTASDPAMPMVSSPLPTASIMSPSSPRLMV